MANTYESKFKGVEVDEGVNIARNLTGTGGIQITTSGTGIDTTKTIKITPVQSTGTGTTDVMSQDAVTKALGKKQDELTESSFVNVGTIASNLGSINNLSCTTFEVTGSPINIGTESSSTIALKGSKIDISGSTGIDFYGDVSFSDGITANRYSSLNGIYVDNSTTNPICFKRNNSIVTKMYGPTSGGGELVNVYLPGKGGTFAMTDDLTGKQDKLTMGAGLSITGNVIYCNGSLTGVTLDVNNIKISGQLDMSGTMVRGGLTYNFPTKGGTFALISDIPTGSGGGTTITADGVVKTAMNASSTGGIETLVMTNDSGDFWVTGGIESSFVDSDIFTASETTEKNYRTEIVPTGIRFVSDAHTSPDLDDGSWLTLHGPTAISGGSFSHTIYLPQKSGTIALLSDITGGGSAGVTSIDGKTGAILLGSGLTIGSNNVLSVVQTTNYAHMYLHRIIGYFDRSGGSYKIMISVYNGADTEFTGDTLNNFIQQLFEYQYASVVIAKTDGSTFTGWDPTKFEQLYVGTIVDDTLYCNFNEMSMSSIQLYDIPFETDIMEEIPVPVS